jgi:hypothetical protein
MTPAHAVAGGKHRGRCHNTNAEVSTIDIRVPDIGDIQLSNVASLRLGSNNYGIWICRAGS